MAGTMSINIAEERGAVAISADIDQLAVVIGCSSLGSGLSPFYLSAASAIAAVGYGDAVDSLTQIIEQRQGGGASSAKFPAALYSTPADTNGSYGTVDQSGITGEGQVAAGATQPYGTYEAQLLWVNGGVVGTAGMTIRWSLDGGRTYSSAVALGTATSYTIPNSNVKFDLSPSSIDLTALNTLLNELKGDYNAHRVLTGGSEHGAADTANVVTAADATNTATRIALANDIRAQYEAHRILTAGGVHGAADTTNVITVPVATDDSSALALALVLQAEYNDHIALTAGSVHGAADVTNDSDSPAPDAGTFNAGDVVAVRTFAPAPGATEIADAFTALAESTIDCSLVILDFPCSAALAAVVTTGLNAMVAAGKDCAALVRTRLPDFENSETETAWGDAIIDDFANFEDSRIAVRAAYKLVTDAVTTRQYLRSDLAQFAADCVRVGRFVWPCAPNDRAMPNASLVDSTGATIGHDEGPRGAFTGLSNETLGNRFSCVQRLPDATRREDVFNTVPWVHYAADEKIRNLMVRRLVNAMRRVTRAAGTPALGGLNFYKGTSPSTGTLSETSRTALQGRIYQALREEFRGEVENVDEAALDSGLVQVLPTVTVSGGNLLGASIKLAPRVGGFLLSVDVGLGIQE